MTDYELYYGIKGSNSDVTFNDWGIISVEDPVRAYDAFVDALDFESLGFVDHDSKLKVKSKPKAKAKVKADA